MYGGCIPYVMSALELAPSFSPFFLGNPGGGSHLFAGPIILPGTKGHSGLCDIVCPINPSDECFFPPLEVCVLAVFVLLGPDPLLLD